MTYVITGSCIKDDSCVEVCPVDCIHPKRGAADFETAVDTTARTVGAYYVALNEFERELYFEELALNPAQELVATEERPIGDVHQKGLSGDMRPFEVWIYEGDIPLPPDAEPSVSENRRYRKLVFLFVDEQGLGDYRLRYSTE